MKTPTLSIALALLFACAFESTYPPDEDNMPEQKSAATTARTIIRAHAKIRSNTKVGLRNPAQVMANTTVPGGPLPFLWLADRVTVDDETPIIVDSWQTRNQIGKPEGIYDSGATVILPIPYTTYPLTSASDAARPRWALTAGADMRPIPSPYLNDAPGAATLMSMTFPADYFMTDDDNVSYSGEIFGLVIARPLDLTANTQVFVAGNIETGELVTLHRHASQTAWALTAAGSGHAMSIGSAAATPLDSTKFQVVRFRLNSSHVHSLQVGQRAPVSSSAGSNGYDWGPGVSEGSPSIIETFTNSSARTVQIAAAFFTFGGNPTADQEAEIDAWLAFHYPNAIAN